jgi:hypothetical protein
MNTPQSSPQSSEDTADDRLREKLAAIEHERWSDWQAWCHKILRENCPSPELEKVLERWDRQIATPYDKLSDSEKASDMEQVDRYWPLVASYLAEQEAELLVNLRRNAITTFANGTVIPVTVVDAELARLRKGNTGA